MFKASQKRIFTVNDIKNHMQQEELFFKYTGIWPNLNNRYCSIIRPDKKPDCRFKWHDGFLWFIDNAGFNNKLAFNIIDVVSILNNISYNDAVQLIGNNNVILNNISTPKNENNDIEIRFKYLEWPKENIFDLDHQILIDENVFNINEYWIRNKGLWTHYKQSCIGYYFPESNHVKLYFPDKKENRWFTNCNNDDIYGIDKLQYYWERDDSLIIITKSQKDRLILDYKYGYNVIALQNERSFINHELAEMLDMFKRKIIVFDNDNTGIERSTFLAKKYNYESYFYKNFKDSYECYKNNAHDEIKNIKNEN